MGYVEQFERIPERYRLDKRELGKVLVVASTALLVVSVHSVLVFQSTAEDVKKADKQLEKAQAVMSTSAFNQSMQAIGSIETFEEVNIYNQFRQASKAFSSAKNATSELSSARERIESSYELYQWLVLVSILGIVAGISVMYILEE
ncbi:MAG: hypothetical protein ABEJ36_01100 [Candidatus Nanosalina sp.]